MGLRPHFIDQKEFKLFYVFSHSGGYTPITFWGYDDEANIVAVHHSSPDTLPFDVAIGMAIELKTTDTCVCIGHKRTSTFDTRIFDSGSLVPIINV